MKTLASLLFLFFLTGCVSSPKYIEKNSEALSRSVYATGDSLVLGRIELAKKFSDESQKLVPPPKERIPIASVTNGKAKVVTLPASLSGAVCVEENTESYKKLVKVEEENKVLQYQVKLVEEERQKQDEIRSQLLKDYNDSLIKIANQAKELVKKDLVILYLVIAIVLLVAGIGASFYFKLVTPLRLL